MDKNILVKCKLCENFEITHENMKEALKNKSMGHLMAKKLALKLGGEKGLKKVMKVGLLKKDERLLGEYLKGTLISHLALKHKRFVLIKYPKFRGGLRSWEVTKKAFTFNWKELKKYDIEE